MSAPRLHASLTALLTLPPELRACVEESMRRDARSLATDVTDPPVDPSRVSMTAHLRAVLVERGMMPIWRRHFEQSRTHVARHVIETPREELAPIFGEFVAAPA